MKKLPKIVLIICLLLIVYAFGQTNVFPANGFTGIGTMFPAAGLQLGSLNADIVAKQPLIPGAYNFENLMPGHAVNGSMALEMVNHISANYCYGMRLTTNADYGGQGLQFQLATAQSTYGALYFQTRMFLSVNGQLGICTTVPQGRLEVVDPHNSANTPLLSFRANFHVPGNYGMIKFGDYTQTSDYQKGANFTLHWKILITQEVYRFQMPRSRYCLPVIWESG